jgi:Low-density lipoprotein receptor repeat class B
MRGRVFGARLALALGIAALAALVWGAAGAGAYVYWSDGATGTIGRAANDGTHVDPSLIGGLQTPQALAVDSGHIYWASIAGHAIGRARIDGSSVEPEFIKLPYEPNGVAVNASHVFWSNGPGSRIGRANLDGGAQSNEFITGIGGPCGLTIDAGYIYWPTGNFGPGYIERVPISGGTVDSSYVEIPSVIFPCGIAVNSSNVYWSDTGAGSGTNIGRANLVNGNGVLESYIGEASGPCGIAVFESKLYWDNAGTATIARSNTDTTGLEYEWLHTGAEKNQICGIAVDSLAPSAEPPPGGGGGGGGSGSDTTPPQTKIKSGPGRKLAKGLAKFAFSSSEPGSSFTCKLDKKKPARCRSPKTYTGLEPGRHTFKAWATDAAGDEDPTPAARSFKISG